MEAVHRAVHRNSADVLRSTKADKSCLYRSTLTFSSARMAPVNIAAVHAIADCLAGWRQRTTMLPLIVPSSVAACSALKLEPPPDTNTTILFGSLRNDSGVTSPAARAARLAARPLQRQVDRGPRDQGSGFMAAPAALADHLSFTADNRAASCWKHAATSPLGQRRSLAQECAAGCNVEARAAAAAAAASGRCSLHVLVTTNIRVCKRNSRQGRTPGAAGCPAADELHLPGNDRGTGGQS